jgi:predicted HTH transcriptional regulator
MPFSPVQGMSAAEVLELIGNGETTKVQFKSDVNNVVSIAQELVAFSNTKGGVILIGVDDKTGKILSLSFQDIQRINNLLAAAAQDHVKSPILISTETVKVNDNRVIAVSVPEGMDKPHTDKDGVIWVKNGSDKRKVTSKEELARLLQSSGNLYAEEMLLQHSSLSDLNWDKFQAFYEEKYKEPCEKENMEKHLENLRLGGNGKLNLAGALLFGKNQQKLTPAFFITAIWFRGNNITATDYRSSENITGTLDQQYRRGYDFLVAKLDKLQAGQPFNSLGKSEVPEVVITELLVNALIHRDYFIHDSIKIFLFDDRIEITSPGKLPNNLTAEQIRRGVRRSRNHIIASLAPDLLEYRGAGSGILRALKAYPHIQFINDAEGEQFKVIIQRPEKK